MTGYGAYDKNIKTTESPHETDAAVLEHAAQVLIAAQTLMASDELENDEDFFMALNYNQRIWTVLQAFAAEENLIPDQIKANLISLSIFVDKQTYKAMSNNDPTKLDVLININRQIAAGFRSIPPAEEKPA
jgi:flagellar protein FlaF